MAAVLGLALGLALLLCGVVSVVSSVTQSSRVVSGMAVDVVGGEAEGVVDELGGGGGELQKQRVLA